ncbi:hypothetical protein SAY86_010728 [Trapa natans]|uniref:Uncharacterized protein n=1 Tax=Trapa natans TaxID=22666 RepID=A0AAN7LSR5_TRANT|nr:hypothetical protein SAY86_010728 [Trapa natans]
MQMFYGNLLHYYSIFWLYFELTSHLAYSCVLFFMKERFLGFCMLTKKWMLFVLYGMTTYLYANKKCAFSSVLLVMQFFFMKWSHYYWKNHSSGSDRTHFIFIKSDLFTLFHFEGRRKNFLVFLKYIIESCLFLNIL